MTKSTLQMQLVSSVFALIGSMVTIHSFAFAQSYDEEYLFHQPGLLAEYQARDSRAGTIENKPFFRVDKDLLFDWASGAVDVRLAKDAAFQVAWRGQLQAKENGDFTISVFANGKTNLKLGGQEILSTESSIKPQWIHSVDVPLKFGKHELEITYESPNSTTKNGQSDNRTAAYMPPHFGLYWSGPSFQLEPIPARLLTHKHEQLSSAFDQQIGPQPSSRRFEMGKQLSRGLRCAACHDFGTQEEILPGPSLTHLQDNLRPSWLVTHLQKKNLHTSPTRTAQSREGDFSVIATRRMPYYGLDKNSAMAITAALFRASEESESPRDRMQELVQADKQRKKNDPDVRLNADAAAGAVTFASKGCLACHQTGELGETKYDPSQVFSGGDLSELATKRTTSFLARWLDAPATINAAHRMPQFDLSANEHLDLVAHLSSMGAENSRNDTRAAGDHKRGVSLIKQLRCASCHEMPKSLAKEVANSKVELTRLADGRWKSKSPDTGKPNFHDHCQPVTTHLERLAIDDYHARRKQTSNSPSGEQLLVENNCVNCHSRDLAVGIAAHLPAVAEAYPETASRLAGLSPPSITGVGDKLTDAALTDSVLQKHPPLRPWLDVRMPKFRLSDEQTERLVKYLVNHDRIPEDEAPVVEVPSSKAAELAAARLVTAEGFGCQSCHQIGDGEMPQVDLKARGTNLGMLGSRVRPSWFHRWVRNPSRIIPRMEMPAIQTAAKGVLGGDLDVQLEALWRTLNTPDFRPPSAGAVRVVRNHNDQDLDEHTQVVTCVIETPNQNYLRPLIFGLPNRHNVLFDLETGQLAGWWIGDTARQYTRGKTWYWELGNPFLNPEMPLERISIVDANGLRWKPFQDGQLTAQLDSMPVIDQQVEWTGRLSLQSDTRDATRVVALHCKLEGAPGENRIRIHSRLQLEAGDQVEIRVGDLSQGLARGSVPSQPLVVPLSAESQVAFSSATAMATTLESGNGSATYTVAANERGEAEWTSEYSTTLPLDILPKLPTLQIPAPPIKQLDCVPGYEAVRLPLPTNEMPISFAWTASGRFYAGSLKGNVLELIDDDRDGLHDRYRSVSVNVPTPYGLQAVGEELDVLSKFAILRLNAPDDDAAAVPAVGETTHGNSAARPFRIVADGWGYTADYHDWAVGLERDRDGNYIMALPCQQDDRSEASAYLRGQALKLVPTPESEDRFRDFRIEPISAGLRFPMGLALNRAGDLFASDNQGNYNPFNEINHLLPGKRYGFINKLENKDGFSPPFESPAVNLPHPWTRSVNGICFLDTPEPVRKQSGSNLFGPFEGHLLGCEMNGLSLVRMSLQKVGDTYQGAAYAFSLPDLDPQDTFEGPIVCEVAPNGDIYVGNLKDSGWGGGQNTGSIVRLRPNKTLPVGIAEVRATATGFEIDFTQPVDPQQAVVKKNYQMRSYRRISTPIYGGDDQDDRAESAQSVEVAADGRRVTIQLAELREGFVYEINIGDIGIDETELFPNQAHYTMRSIPAESSSE